MGAADFDVGHARVAGASDRGQVTFAFDVHAHAIDQLAQRRPRPRLPQLGRGVDGGAPQPFAAEQRALDQMRKAFADNPDDIAATDMAPFRDVFSALFFVSIGMLFNPAFVTSETCELVLTRNTTRASSMASMTTSFSMLFSRATASASKLAAIAELAVMLRAVHQTRILERNEVREAPQLLDRARTGRAASRMHSCTSGA